MNTPNPALAERLWQRHTLGQKLARTAFWLGIGIAVLLSLRNINVIWEFLWDAPEQMLDMVQRMFPPDYAYYRVAVHTALMETFHIATLGTIFALVAALPLSILAAHNLTPNRGLNFLAKTRELARLGAAFHRRLRPRPAGGYCRYRLPLRRLCRQTAR